MYKEVITHMCTGAYAYATAENELKVRLKAKKDDLVQVYVHYLNVYDHSKNRKIVRMSKILSDEFFDMFEASLYMDAKHFKYFFELRSENEVLFYTSDGFMEDGVENENSFFYPVINKDDIYHIPSWAKGAVFYQIFVDRFFSSKKKDFTTKRWGELPDRTDFYGGDFEGIRQKLDYIQSLGVDVIYLSPVFESVTNHKYDIKDYYKIDEMLGGEKALLDLVNSIHDKGMKIVLDCVFNHMGADNAIFLDVVNKGMQSKYHKWFNIHSYPVDIDKGNYDSFAGCVPSMPKLDTSNPEVIRYLVDSAVYWTKRLSLDGWRLDVADEVSHSLWRDFRYEVTKVNPDALIIGEVWNDASKWMMGDQLHTMTNYKYRKWLLEVANESILVKTFWDKIASNNMLYKSPSLPYLINLLGSHDTKRIAEAVPGKSMLALLCTFAFQGSPLLYYADELSLPGGEDPDNRRTMPWDEVGDDCKNAIVQFAKLRKKYPHFKYGDMKAVCNVKETSLNDIASNELLVFERTYKDSKVEVYVNFTNKQYEIARKTEIFSYSEETKLISDTEKAIDKIAPLSFTVCI